MVNPMTTEQVNDDDGHYEDYSRLKPISRKRNCNCVFCKQNKMRTN